MIEPLLDFRLTFVYVGTGQKVLVPSPTGGKPGDPSSICRATNRAGVERRCAAILPKLALSLGVPVTRIEGRITELVPAMGADPAMAAALTAS